jgi:death-on-curing protein
MREIKISEVEHLAHRLARKHLSWDEPIPDFSTRYAGILESCLATAFQTYGKRSLYKTLDDKAAIIFYLMIKNHPLLNGNKRVAVTPLLVFLVLNDKWLSASPEELYQIAVEVAESNPRFKDGVVSEIKKFVRRYSVPFE